MRASAEQRLVNGVRETKSASRLRPEQPARGGLLGPSNVLALQRQAGNRAVVQAITKTTANQSAPKSTSGEAWKVADTGFEKLKDAVVAAAAAVVMKSVEGKTKYGIGSSKRAGVVQSREDAGKLADILGFAAARDLQTATGLIGTVKDSGDAKQDERDKASLVRQRAQANKKSLEDSSAELKAAYMHAALKEGSLTIVRDHLNELVPATDMAAARVELTRVAYEGYKAKSDAAAAKSVAGALPKLSKKMSTKAVDAISGSKNKALRDLLKDESATAATKELEKTVAEEIGPGAKKSKLTAKAVEATYTSESVGTGLKLIGTLIDKVAGHNGDSMNLSVLLKIPVGHGAFVGLKVTGDASKAADRTKVGATFSFAAGWEAPQVAQALLEIGGYLATASERGGVGNMEMASYALYRRCRESNGVPRALTSQLWSDGGGSKTKDQTTSDAKYIEAEAWASQVEDKMTEADYAESGLHLGASGKVGNEKLAHGSAGVTLDTGTRYTKKGIDKARGAGKGKAVLGQLGKQESIGTKVTTLRATGSAGFNLLAGATANAQLESTFADKKEAGKREVFAFSVDGGLGFKVPSTTNTGKVVSWIASGVSSVGSAIIDSLNKVKTGDGVPGQVVSDVVTAGEEVAKFPSIEKTIEDKGEALLTRVEDEFTKPSGTSTATSAATSGATKTGLLDTLEKGYSSASGIQVFAVLDIHSPSHSYIAVRNTSNYSFDISMLEASVTKSSSILYFDFKNRSLEVGGSRLGGTS